MSNVSEGRDRLRIPTVHIALPLFLRSLLNKNKRTFLQLDQFLRGGKAKKLFGVTGRIRVCSDTTLTERLKGFKLYSIHFLLKKESYKEKLLTTCNSADGYSLSIKGKKIIFDI